MSLNDPIADYLTRLRNAGMAKHGKVDIPSSKIRIKITELLKEEGYIQNYTLVEDEKQGMIRIYLKYGEGRKHTITGLKRISRPGFRQYTGTDDIPRVLNGLGIAILSTPQGILTDKKARKNRVGGEILCYVW